MGIIFNALTVFAAIVGVFGPAFGLDYGISYYLLCLPTGYAFATIFEDVKEARE